jgi:hypothetical protein
VIGAVIGRRVLIATGIAAPAVVRAQPKPGLAPTWYAVQLGDGAFSVEMPGIPDHKVIADASARGTPFELHSYSLESGGNSFVAQTALYPEDVDTRQPRRLLQAALDGRAGQLAGGKWSRTDWREIAGATAVESSGRLANGNQLRQLSLLKQRRFVSLAFLGPNATAAEADRFFNSLKARR